MKHIYTNESIVLLHAAKNFLTLHGIESFVRNEYSASNGARHGIENIFLELWLLHDSQFARAEALLAEQFVSPKPRPEWECSMCHEKNDGSFEFCWNCQSRPNS